MNYSEDLCFLHSDRSASFLGAYSNVEDLFEDSVIKISELSGFFSYNPDYIRDKWDLFEFAEPLDVSKFVLQGEINWVLNSGGRIEFGQYCRRINYHAKDLAPSFGGKITEGTAVKFKLSVDSNKDLCAIDIQPL